MWLTGDLITATTTRDLLAIIDMQTHLTAIMELVSFIISRDSYGLSVNKAIKMHGRAQRHYLLDNLLHLALREGLTVQTVNALIVVVKDIRPVIEQILFRMPFFQP